MSQNEERRKAMELADMPLLADHYQKLSDRENSGGATAMATSGGGGKGGDKVSNQIPDITRKM